MIARRTVAAVLAPAALSGATTLIGVVLALRVSMRSRYIALGLGFSAGMMVVLSLLELMPGAFRLGGAEAAGAGAGAGAGGLGRIAVGAAAARDWTAHGHPGRAGAAKCLPGGRRSYPPRRSRGVPRPGGERAGTWWRGAA